MPFLEQRRGPQPIAAGKLQYLTQHFCFLFPTPRDWALTWSVCHLLSFVLGGWFAGQVTIPLIEKVYAWRNCFVLLSVILPAGLYFAKRPTITFFIWFFVFCLGLISGFSETQQRTNRRAVTAPEIMEPSLVNTWNARTLIRTTGWPVLGDNGKWKIPAILVRLDILESPKQVSDSPKPGQGILLSGQGTVPVPGQLLAATQKITIPYEGDLSGMFDYRLFLAGRGIQWIGLIVDQKPPEHSGVMANVFSHFLSPIRTKILLSLRTILPPMESSLAGSVLLGARDQSSRSASKPFSDLGLAHLFAVSGLHVGVLLGLFLLPGKLLGISSWQKWLFLCVILPFYALLTGLPGSVIRAAGLAMLATAATPFGRLGRPLHFLGLLFWITTIWSPDQVLDVGVRLSYVAAGGILSFTTISRKINYPRKGFWGFILGGLLISFSAQWFTLPLAASSFGRLSLLSPLANLIAVPAFGIAVWLVVIALMLSFLPGGLGSILGALAWLLLRSLAAGVNEIQNSTGGYNFGLPVPNPLIIIFWIISSIGILCILNLTAKAKIKKRWAVILTSLFASVCIFVFGNPGEILQSDQGPEVWQFDVGQGDGSLVRFPDGWVAMIDNGGRFGFRSNNLDGPWSRSILPWLRRHQLADPDVVILTHGHMDHTGGSGILLKESKVGLWLVAGKAARCLFPDSSTININFPVQGDVIHRWEDWSLVIRYPIKSIPHQFHENDFSIVVALEHHGQTQYLWSGDLENEGEELLLDAGGPGGRTRIWKASHHGSNTSGSQRFMNAIHPELILVSCGVGNGYHHPNHGFYVVNGDTIKVVRTDLEGSIHVKFGRNGEIHWKSRHLEGHLPSLP